MGGCKGRRNMEERRRDVAERGLSRLDVATSILTSRHGQQWLEAGQERRCRDIKFEVATWSGLSGVATPM